MKGTLPPHILYAFMALTPTTLVFLEDIMNTFKSVYDSQANNSVTTKI